MKRGKGYSVNVPLRDGITDDAFHSIFKPVSVSAAGLWCAPCTRCRQRSAVGLRSRDARRCLMEAGEVQGHSTDAQQVISKIMETFRPGAVVLGADSLSGDKLGGFNLTLQGMSCRLRTISRSAGDWPG